MICLDQLRNGLAIEQDYFFAERPEDPQMRESTSVWLFDESGRIGFPRVGIEAEAHSWDDRLFHVNIALSDGRVLVDSGRGAVPSSMDSNGNATVFGAGPLIFRCIEPFQRWLMCYEGCTNDGSSAQQASGRPFVKPKTNIKIEVELTMETPAWVQDYSPEKVAQMTQQEKENAQSMGIGWRLEQLCRGRGTFTLDATTHELNLVGLRIKRQGVRPLNAFRGHCWQSALFPDGRAFGTISYPATKSAALFNIAYVYVDGVMIPARAKKIPFLKQITEQGEDVSLELETHLGTHKISASSCLSTFKVNNADMAALGAKGFTLQQAAALYHWDDMSSIGMIERSATGLC